MLYILTPVYHMFTERPDVGGTRNV